MRSLSSLNSNNKGHELWRSVAQPACKGFVSPPSSWYGYLPPSARHLLGAHVKCQGGCMCRTMRTLWLTCGRLPKVHPATALSELSWKGPSAASAMTLQSRRLPTPACSSPCPRALQPLTVRLCPTLRHHAVGVGWLGAGRQGKRGATRSAYMFELFRVLA